MPKVATSRLKKWFGELPVKEARADLIIQPSQADIKQAKRNDPRHCIFANACSRMYGSKSVLFFKRYSYVDMLNEKGERVVYRFENSPELQKCIEEFDEKNLAKEGAFMLRRPAKSRKLGSRKHYKPSSKPRVAGSKVKKFRRPKPVHGRYLQYLEATA